MNNKVDYKQISETNYKILKAILEDDSTLLEGLAKTIKDTWSRNNISEFIYQILDNDKLLCKEIEG